MPLIKQKRFKFAILCDVFLLMSTCVISFPVIGFLNLLHNSEAIEQNISTTVVNLVNTAEQQQQQQMAPIQQHFQTEPSSQTTDPENLKLLKRFDMYRDSSKIPYDTIHRILRDEESSYRSDDFRFRIRWKKSTEAISSSSKNSNSGSTEEHLLTSQSSPLSLHVRSQSHDIVKRSMQSDNVNTNNKNNTFNNSNSNNPNYINSNNNNSSNNSNYNNIHKNDTNYSNLTLKQFSTTSSSYNHSTKSIDLMNKNLTNIEWDRVFETNNNESMLTVEQTRQQQIAQQFSLSEGANLSEIVQLNLTRNLLTEFNISKIAKLIHLNNLDLSYNKLRIFRMDDRSNDIRTDIMGKHSSPSVAPISNSLINVNLSCNNVSMFLMSERNMENAKLKYLDLSGNNIKSMEFVELNGLNALEELDLSCNRLTYLDRKLFANGKSLKRLNLSHNRLSVISKQIFENLLGIDTLILSHNSISMIEFESFLYLANLQYLDLSYNDIHADSIRALQGIPDLVGLSIANNPNLGDSLQEFVASWSLKELDASGTGLCRIPAALAQSVRTLKLMHNWISVIRCGDLDSYPLLQYLDLSSSHIDEIEDDALGRLEILETLFLDHNNLRRVPISLPTSLKNLFLHNNQIMDMQAQTFQQLVNLKILDLSGNKLMYMPGLPLPKLLTLNLQSSELRGLSQSVVKTSPKLRDLLLDGNPIKCPDLLGIAEWVSLCRNDRITERMDIKKNFDKIHQYTESFRGSNKCRCKSDNNESKENVQIMPVCAQEFAVNRKLLQTNNNETGSALQLAYEIMERTANKPEKENFSTKAEGENFQQFNTKQSSEGNFIQSLPMKENTLNNNISNLPLQNDHYKNVSRQNNNTLSIKNTASILNNNIVGNRANSHYRAESTDAKMQILSSIHNSSGSYLGVANMHQNLLSTPMKKKALEEQNHQEDGLQLQNRNHIELDSHYVGKNTHNSELLSDKEESEISTSVESHKISRTELVPNLQSRPDAGIQKLLPTNIDISVKKIAKKFLTKSTAITTDTIDEAFEMDQYQSDEGKKRNDGPIDVMTKSYSSESHPLSIEDDNNKQSDKPSALNISKQLNQENRQSNQLAEPKQDIQKPNKLDIINKDFIVEESVVTTPPTTAEEVLPEPVENKHITILDSASNPEQTNETEFDKVALFYPTSVVHQNTINNRIPATFPPDQYLHNQSKEVVQNRTLQYHQNQNQNHASSPYIKHSISTLQLSGKNDSSKQDNKIKLKTQSQQQNHFQNNTDNQNYRIAGEQKYHYDEQLHLKQIKQKKEPNQYGLDTEGRHQSKSNKIQKKQKLRTAVIQGKRYNHENQHKKIISKSPASDTTGENLHYSTLKLDKQQGHLPYRIDLNSSDKNHNNEGHSQHKHTTVNEDKSEFNHNMALDRTEEIADMKRTTVLTSPAYENFHKDTTFPASISHHNLNTAKFYPLNSYDQITQVQAHYDSHTTEDNQDNQRTAQTQMADTKSLNTVPNKDRPRYEGVDGAIDVTTSTSSNAKPITMAIMIMTSNSTINKSTSSRLGVHANSSIGSGLPPEQLLAIRTTTGHPGLFVVIGVTFGMLLTLGLIHIYRCRKPWYPHSRHSRHHNHHHSHHSSRTCRHNANTITDSNCCCQEDDDDYYIEVDQEVSSPKRTDFLPMELLSLSSSHSADNHPLDVGGW